MPHYQHKFENTTRDNNNNNENESEHIPCNLIEPEQQSKSEMGHHQQ
jgi:hypothetical protein